MAQSKIQCVQGSDGQYQAALIWQNTLGIERANSICRMYAPAPSHAASQEPVVREASQVVSGSRFDSSVYQKAAQRSADSTPMGRIAATVDPTPTKQAVNDDRPAKDQKAADYVQMW
jgi:hypothetical protein